MHDVVARRQVRRAALAVLVAALLSAPAYGAAHRSASHDACAAPLCTCVLHLGIAHSLPAAAVTLPAAPAPLGRAVRDDAQARPRFIALSCARARAPPCRSLT